MQDNCNDILFSDYKHTLFDDEIKPISKELVLQLFEKYGVPKQVILSEEYDILLSVCVIPIEHSPSLVDKILELAELASFLEKCGNAEVKLTGQSKSQIKHCKVSGSLLVKLLSDALHLTSFESIIESKKTFGQIRSEVFGKFTKCTFIGQGMNSIVNIMNDCELFSEWTKRKVYCLLYDICVLNGLTESKGDDFEGEIAKEKEDWVDYRLQSYQKVIYTKILPPIMGKRENS